MTICDHSLVVTELPAKSRLSEANRRVTPAQAAAHCCARPSARKPLRRRSNHGHHRRDKGCAAAGRAETQNETGGETHTGRREVAAGRDFPRSGNCVQQEGEDARVTYRTSRRCTRRRAPPAEGRRRRPATGILEG